MTHAASEKTEEFAVQDAAKVTPQRLKLEFVKSLNKAIKDNLYAEASDRARRHYAAKMGSLKG